MWNDFIHLIIGGGLASGDEVLVFFEFFPKNR
jgi:uncharacterized membrane protein YkvI